MMQLTLLICSLRRYHGFTGSLRPFIEFAYTVMCTLLLNFYHLKLCMDLTLLTPTNLIYLDVDERVSLDGNPEAQVVKTLSMRVCGNRLKRGIVCVQPKPIRGANMLSFSPRLGLGAYAQGEISSP